ncbi:hypothetical protein ACFQ7B_43290 [Streptomyces erythrochromogenes]|uniref:hypothetical protein n=1 Tax=Streptomyces erythrochromogenes TaxID=285574 RepID=UPI003697F87C
MPDNTLQNAVTVKIDQHQIKTLTGNTPIPSYERDYRAVEYVNEQGIKGNHYVIDGPKAPPPFTFSFIDDPNDEADDSNTKTVKEWAKKGMGKKDRVNFSIVIYKYGKATTIDTKGAALVSWMPPAGAEAGSVTIVADEWIPGQ